MVQTSKQPGGQRHRSFDSAERVFGNFRIDAGQPVERSPA
jgi:hypothetical protein